MLVDSQIPNDEAYEQLIRVGFRRSGNQVYRPHCDGCHACQSIRVKTQLFKPNKSQKRALAKFRDLQINIIAAKSAAFTKLEAEYYDLYARYINERHADSSMFPPSKAQFDNFILSEWQSIIFIEARLGQQLVAVAVTDVVSDGYSALYTFYDSAPANASIGTFMICQQILLAQQQHLPYVYLGYQIDACQKMNYKEKFVPNERFNGTNWYEKRP